MLKIEGDWKEAVKKSLEKKETARRLVEVKLPIGDAPHVSAI